jgi:hypothetical protein
MENRSRAKAVSAAPRWAACLLLLAAAGSVRAQAPEWRTIELLPSGSKAHPLRLSVEATVYVKDGRGKEIAKGAAAPDEAFLATMLETYRSGTIDAALKLWAPEEREHKRTTLESGGGVLFKKNQDIHKQLARVELLTKVFYGDFILFGVRYHMSAGGETYTLVYPAVNRGGQYFLTDALANDATFTCLGDRIVKDLALPSRP